jgi:hypothetical protein
MTVDRSDTVVELVSVIADAWGEVLGVGDIDMESDFYELGGHSILGARICRILQERSGVSVTLRDLFSAPTVGELAVLLAGRHNDPPRTDPATSAADVIEGGVSALQEDMLDFVAGAGRRADLMAIRWAYRLAGPVDLAALSLAFTDVVQRHEQLRTGFQRGSCGDFSSVIHKRTPEALSIVDARDLPAAERSRLDETSRQVAGHLAPEEPPHLRATLVRLSDHEATLVCEANHVAFDGVSRGIVDHDLARAYSARVAGGPPRWAVPRRFAEFTAEQSRATSLAAFDAAIEHWRDILRDIPAHNHLSAPAESDMAAMTVDVRLPLEVTSRVSAYAAAAACGVSTVYLTAWMLTLTGLLGQDDIAVAVPVALRDEAQYAETVGPMVNQLVVRAAPRRAAQNTEVAVVRDAFLKGWNHRAVHHATACRAAGSDFRYRFRMGFHDLVDTPPDLVGLEVTALPVAADTTLRRDAALELSNSGDGISGVLACRTATGIAPDHLVSEFRRNLRALLKQEPVR